jgi:uncharacterized protein
MTKKLLIIVVGSSLICLFLLCSILAGVFLDKGLVALKEENYSKARFYLTPLALLGKSAAQYELGWMYAFGEGVQQDDAQAIRWFRRTGAWVCAKDITCSDMTDSAAPSEYFVAQRYAELYRLQKSSLMASQAIKWYKRSARGGYSKAANVLSDVYRSGAFGVNPDHETARFWEHISGIEERQGRP